MAITRVKPGGWATYEKLTSTQLNAIDQNPENALDKRSGQTDTLASDVAVTGDLDITGDVTIRNNLTFDTAAGTGNIVLTSSEVRLSTSGSLFVASGGSIKMATSSQVPTFDAAQNYTRQILPFAPLDNSGDKWSYVAPAFSPGGFEGTYGTSWINNGTQYFSCDIPNWAGASLTQVEVYYTVRYSHFPTTKLHASLVKSLASDPSVGGFLGSVTYAAGTDAASYYNSGDWQKITLTVTPEVLDAQYRYILNIYSGTENAGIALSGAAATYSVPNLGPK